jgi:protein-S-isoprenylcysteine O-methyltransferase Ste14
VYVILIIIRTRREDQTLRAELPGYPEYAARTRFRLIPGLW